ncbi:MAG: hypothetical protein ABI131_07180 [Nostocoides sp.]
MFDQVLGLPVQALVTHLVVVLGPLAALAAIGYAARPAWRYALTWPTVALAVSTGVTSFVAAQSGQALEQRLLTTQAALASRAGRLIVAHASAGTRMRLIGLIFMVVTVVIVLWVLPATPRQRNVTDPVRRQRRSIALLAAGVLVVAGLGVLVQVTVTGHSGARAVWSGIG